MRWGDGVLFAFVARNKFTKKKKGQKIVFDASVIQLIVTSLFYSF